MGARTSGNNWKQKTSSSQCSLVGGSQPSIRAIRDDREGQRCEKCASTANIEIITKDEIIAPQYVLVLDAIAQEPKRVSPLRSY